VKGQGYSELIFIQKCPPHSVITYIYKLWLVGFMVVNATFNNISDKSWWSVLLVE
jgi:hypothetical protein